MKLAGTIVSFLCLSFGLAAAAEKAARPNIIVVLSDDFGYGSAACLGGTDLQTPSLDRLAREGRRFTHAYAPGSVCSPTRYGLMTGRYYWRTSVKDGEVLPGNAPLHIETDRLTLASLCKSQGYRTAAFGKWHLGMGTQRITDWSGSLKPGPLEIGFDYFFGLGSNPWTGPHTFIENHEVLGKLPGQSVVVQSGTRQQNTTTGIEKPWKEEQIMQSLTAQVVSWLGEQKPGEPFFMYYAPNAVHRPVAPHPKFSGSKYGIYGDFIHELDWSVGQILDKLDRLKLADNTLVLFTSDNGGVINRNNEEAAKAMDAGLAINGTLRGGKHDVWEGGFREPFLVRWPGNVPAGTVSPQVICHTDVLATLANVLNVPLAKGQAEDSFDALRAFTEAQPGPPVRDHVILQSADATYAIRAGDWKLIERVDAPTFEHRNRNSANRAAQRQRAAPQANELFDLKSDPAEAKSVIGGNDALAATLKKLLAESRDRGYTRPGAELRNSGAHGHDTPPCVTNRRSVCSSLLSGRTRAAQYHFHHGGRSRPAGAGLHRRRLQDAQPRCAGQRGNPLRELLRRAAVRTVPRSGNDGPLCVPHRGHDQRAGRAGNSREGRLRRPADEASRLRHGGGRQVAAVEPLHQPGGRRQMGLR